MEPVRTIELPPVMAAPETARVFEALTSDGAKARFVGGCVRDSLLHRPVKDIDIATDAEPERVLRLLAAARLRAIPTGLAHGTVTAVSSGSHYEITTLRHDVETFGRHARVAFTDDWMIDASRRDFTMNALFCGIDGDLYDPFGGVGDALAGHVRFVGDPRARITEDVLRLLRFFRFQAHYGRTPPEPAALEACAELAPLLPTLSGERIHGELFRLLRAHDPVPVLRLMAELDVPRHLLPRPASPEGLHRLLEIARHRDDPVLRLAALLETDRAGALAVAERLRLSNAETDRLALLAAPPPSLLDAIAHGELRRALYQAGVETVRDVTLLRAPERLAEVGLAIAAWDDPKFPLQGRDLIDAGVPPGKGMGQLLRDLERWWEDRDHRPSREDCLTELRGRLGDPPGGSA
ncbi:poly-A polymerase [Skermanella stibiiresistens SB22]|uniref:Poly-A polymerase n=1 Tax=Skermanella stibiiresistens SB22 TaxID=1385369 RepID=W9HBD0_9PROT|nr:CCA tRNA nucleotidyltransferase [Skermanella stibiiresistens]EWY41153.1 poly-A polymerase [Skermanella stibiiresistens SB22]